LTAASAKRAARHLGRDTLVTVLVVAGVTALRFLLAPVLSDRSSFTLFTLAVMFSAWSGGFRMGILSTAVATVAGLWLFVWPFNETGLHALSDAMQIVLFVVAGFGISVLAEQLHRARERAEQIARERELLIAQLQGAIANVRTLSGLIPICAGCKKIRDDTGYWHQLEVYIRDHSEADFSHSLCPDCAKNYWDQLEK
jgi:K+-sensing histidine kinase KdpD